MALDRKIWRICAIRGHATKAPACAGEAREAMLSALLHCYRVCAVLHRRAQSLLTRLAACTHPNEDHYSTEQVLPANCLAASLPINTGVTDTQDGSHQQLEYVNANVFQQTSRGDSNRIGGPSLSYILNTLSCREPNKTHKDWTCT